MSEHLSISAGNHVVKLTVFTDSSSNQISTDIQDTVTVAVNYDRQTRQIAFHTYQYLIMRD